MRRIVFLLCALASSIAGCATIPPDPQFLALLEALKSSNVQQVNVEVLPQVATDTANLDGVNPQVQFQDYVEKLRPRLSQLIGRPGGEVPARLVVQIRELSMASGVGRTLVGSDSLAYLSVRLENLKTKALIAAENNLIARDSGLKGSGNIGFVIAVVANAADSADGARVEKIVQSTVRQLDRWLTFGEAIPADIPRQYVTQQTVVTNNRALVGPPPRPVTVAAPRPVVFSTPPARR